MCIFTRLSQSWEVEFLGPIRIIVTSGDGLAAGCRSWFSVCVETGEIERIYADVCNPSIYAYTDLSTLKNSTPSEEKVGMGIILEYEGPYSFSRSVSVAIGTSLPVRVLRRFIPQSPTLKPRTTPFIYPAAERPPPFPWLTAVYISIIRRFTVPLLVFAWFSSWRSVRAPTGPSTVVPRQASRLALNSASLSYKIITSDSGRWRRM